MSLKKALVALMVAAMVLGSVATVSAAGFSDVAGTKYASAAARLAALNVLKGFEDGTFRPNDTVTRAQMAAIVVRSLNLESAANYAKVDTKFSDVPGSHWGAGYINVAVDQGILRGYPDGTFRPEAQVTYAEALAMLVRVLGYEPAVKGTWPTNYVVKAADIGISKNVNFTANAPAPRGDVALFTDQSLDKPLMIQSGFGTNTEYVVSGTNGTTKQTLIGDKLDLDVLDNVVVNRTPNYALGALQADEVQLGANTYKVVGDQDVDSLLGYIVDAYVKDGKVYGIVPDQPAEKIVKGKVDANTTTTTIALQENDTKSYSFASSYSIWSVSGPLVEGGTYASLSTFLGQLEEDDNNTDGTTGNRGQASVTLFLNDNDQIRFLIYSQTSSGSGDQIVTAVDTQRLLLRGKTRNAGDTESTTRLGDLDGYRIVKNGKVVGLADIKEGDLVSIVTPMNGNNSGHRVLWVSDKKVTGKLDAITDGTSGAMSDAKVKIGDTEYELAPNASVSSDGGKTHESLTSITQAELTDLLGKDVTATLNGRGEVRLISGSASAANEFTAMVVDYIPSVSTATGLKNFVEVEKSDGTTAQYPFKNSDDYADLVTTPNVLPGSVVRMSLDSDGNVKTFTARTLTNDNSVAATDISSDTDSIILNGTRYYVSSDTVIFQIWDAAGGTNNLPDDMNDDLKQTGDIADAVTWSTLRKYTGAALNIDFRVDGSIIKELRIKDGTAISSGGDIGVVTARGSNADGLTLTIVSNGTTKTYNFASSSLTINAFTNENGYDTTAGVVYTATRTNGNINAGKLAEIDPDDVVTFGTNGDGEISSLDEAYATIEGGQVRGATGLITEIDTSTKIVTVSDRRDGGNVEVSFKVDDETQLFDTNGNKTITFADLGVGDMVQVFDTETTPDGVADLIKIMD